MNKTINFKHRSINIAYRDDSDLSVIDEFFVDRMYRALEPIIPSITDPIIDVGAHIGVFSIYSKILNQSASRRTKIIAIEPEPDNYKLLKNNLKLNSCLDVKIIRAALISGKELNTKLFLSKNTHNHSTVSLRGSAQGGDEAIQSPSITVPAINLEQLMKENKIKKIGLLKMDIEGAEFEIILNIENGTWGKIRYAVIEYHESKENKRVNLENTIRSHGFSVEHFPNKFDKRFGLLVCRNKKTA